MTSSELTSNRRATMMASCTIKNRKEHRATFNGCHNAVKTKVLIVLFHRQYTEELGSGLTAKQISIIAGVNYDTLLSRLGKWHSWGYIRRVGKVDGNGRLVFHYSIASRGRNFIEARVPGDVLSRYIREIRENIRSNKRIKVVVR
jgi:hypothetical protein